MINSGWRRILRQQIPLREVAAFLLWQPSSVRLLVAAGPMASSLYFYFGVLGAPLSILAVGWALGLPGGRTLGASPPGSSPRYHGGVPDTPPYRGQTQYGGLSISAYSE